MSDQDVDSTLPGARLHVVEAFIDGERVDLERLEDALADSVSRRHLIELLLLRDAVAGMGPVEWSAARRAQGKRRVVRWLAAAAALVFCVTSGYVAGQRVMVAAATPSSVETVMTIDPAPAAPAPTKVISLQPGVNWTDSREGR